MSTDPAAQVRERCQTDLDELTAILHSGLDSGDHDRLLTVLRLYSRSELEDLLILAMHERATRPDHN